MRISRTWILGLALAVAPAFVAAEDKKAEPATAKDPVCGMTVETKSSEKATYKGKTYYFCSRDEKQAFEKTPEKFVAKKDAKQ